MRGSTNSIKHTHTHIPSMEGVKDWVEKVFNSDKTVDAALFVMAVMLCGWLVYSLSKAFQNSTYVM